MPQQALAGLQVLDLTHYVAGPYCTKLLADYGAEVIKVERPGAGDPARRMGPFFRDHPEPEKGGLFHYLNQNKRGITLNLKAPTGRGIFERLAREADVLVESFRPGVIARLGLEYETLEKLNPGLVMTSISSFGQTGPYRDYRASELVEYALAGWTYGGGEPGREPLRPGPSLAQYIGGLLAAVATMTAFYYRSETGLGQHVDLSIMEALLSTLEYPTVQYLYLGGYPPRTGSPFPFMILPCKDGYIGVHVLTQGQWELMCAFMGMPELTEDPRFQDALSRVAHADEIAARFRPWLLERTAEEVFKGQEWRIPFCLIPTAEEMLRLPQHHARDYFLEVEYAMAGRVAQPGAPFKMSETPWQTRRLAPLLGEHNEEIYGQQLGYDPEDLARLRGLGVI